MTDNDAAPLGGPELSVLHMTLADVEQQLGANAQQLGSMNVEDVLKGLWGSTALETLPSFMRAPSWQQPPPPAKRQRQEGSPAADAAPPSGSNQASAASAAATQAAEHASGSTAAAWEAAATAAQQQQVAQQAAAQVQAQQRQQQQQSGMLPLSSVCMDQIFSWYTEQQANQQGKPQGPQPTMTLSHIFDVAGLQLSGFGPMAAAQQQQQAHVQAIKNRESAARSRAKRQEYTATLEQKVEELKQQNKELREQVITTAAAPPDPYAGELEGELMRRSRTGPF
ncbi:hypothetical protein COHA_008802 [Chlorella ohadii]|uniref:BZIP domain-containing protein n=1 Tax=Chlorella ohadii TaxID=2649997 RepID=A0AAD5H188_9CHLO|nr:hypothetical protein COHA_008802 [Chlorella ohadii]